MISIPVVMITLFGFVLVLLSTVAGIAVAWGKLSTQIGVAQAAQAQAKEAHETLVRAHGDLRSKVERLETRLERDEKHADRTGGFRVPLGPTDPSSR